LQGAVYHLYLKRKCPAGDLPSRERLYCFPWSFIFGGKKISLPITCLLSDEPPLSSTYGNPLRVT